MSCRARPGVPRARGAERAAGSPVESRADASYAADAAADAPRSVLRSPVSSSASAAPWSAPVRAARCQAAASGSRSSRATARAECAAQRAEGAAAWYSAERTAGARTDRRHRDRDQPGVLGRSELIRRARPRQPGGDRRRVLGAAGREYEERLAQALPEDSARAAKAASSCSPTQTAPPRRRPPLCPRLRATAGARGRQRIPAGRGVKPRHRVIVGHTARREELTGGLLRQAGQVELAEAGRVEPSALADPGRNHDGDPFCHGAGGLRTPALRPTRRPASGRSSSATRSGVSSAAAASRLSVAAPTVSLSGGRADVEGECGSKGCRLPGRKLVDPREERLVTSRRPPNAASVSDCTPCARAPAAHRARPRSPRGLCSQSTVSPRAGRRWPRLVLRPGAGRSPRTRARAPGARARPYRRRQGGSGVPRKRSPECGWHDRSRRDGSARLRTAGPR